MTINEPAEYAILGLLYSHAMHGYELFQQFESGTVGQIVHLEMSQMYAYLKKLEKLQYIEAEITIQGTRPPRKIFHLTAAGHTTFFHWLQQPTDKPRDIRILFLIKLYFIQRICPRQTSQLLAKQIEACQIFLRNLETRQEEGSQAETGDSDDAEFFNQVILGSRIYQTRALLEWLHELQVETEISQQSELSTGSPGRQTN